MTLFNLMGHGPLLAIRSVMIMPPRQLVIDVLLMAPIVVPAEPVLASEPMSLTSHSTIAMADLIVNLPSDVAVMLPPGEKVYAAAVEDAAVNAISAAIATTQFLADLRMAYLDSVERSFEAENCRLEPTVARCHERVNRKTD